MKNKYITIIRHENGKEEHFGYTKAQWRLAWLAVFVIGILCGGLRGCF